MHTKLFSPFACHPQECSEKYIKIMDNIALHFVYCQKKNVNSCQEHWLFLSMEDFTIMINVICSLRIRDSSLFLEMVVIQPDHT
jgi:hypothetical protein